MPGVSASTTLIQSFWHKIGKMLPMRLEKIGSKFLGKPYEPNAIVKNDMEFILCNGNGGVQKANENEQREASRIGKEDFGGRWSSANMEIYRCLNEANTLLPFPLRSPLGLYACSPFTGGHGLRTLCGQGTTMIAALRASRKQYRDYEIRSRYCEWRRVSFKVRNRQTFFRR